MLRLILAWAALALLAAGCSSTKPPQPLPDAMSVIRGRSDLTLLAHALQRAGYDDEIAQVPDITILAPDNSAFAAAGLGSTAAIDALPLVDLQVTLLYHVLEGIKPASGLRKGLRLYTLYADNTVSPRNPSAVGISEEGPVRLNNEAELVTGDVEADNGLLHIVNAVLTPPPAPGSLYDIVKGYAQAASPQYTMLFVALRDLNTGSANAKALVSSFSGTAYTLFAPTDAAFVAAGYADTTALKTAIATDAAAVYTIIANHLVSGVRFSPNFVTGNLTTANGGTLAITAGPTPTVKSNGIAAATPFVSRFDVAAPNGVLHTVGVVLRP